MGKLRIPGAAPEVTEEDPAAPERTPEEEPRQRLLGPFQRSKEETQEKGARETVIDPLIRTGLGSLAQAVYGSLETATSALGGAPGGTQDILTQDFRREEQRRGSEVKYDTLENVIDEATGGALIPRTPRQRKIQRTARTASEFATAEMLFPGSTTAKALKWSGIGGLFGLGEQVAIEMGADDDGLGPQAVGAMTALSGYLIAAKKNPLKMVGKAIDFGRGLLRKPPPPSEMEGAAKFLTEPGTERALADLELSKRDLTGRLAKTSTEAIEDFDKQISKLSEPSFGDVRDFSTREIEKDIMKGNRDAVLDTVSPIETTSKKTWETVRETVDGNFQALKETYSSLYNSAEESAKMIKSRPTETYDVAKKWNSELQRGLIKASPEKPVAATFEQMVRELTFDPHVEVRKVMERLDKEGLTADWQEVHNLLKRTGQLEGPVTQVNVDQLMKTKRSIGRILAKSDIIPAPVDLLKPLSAALKRDIRAGLAADQEALRSFDTAEDLYAQGQKIYNNDIIRKLRKAETAEKMSADFISPSHLEKLNNAVGPNDIIKDLAQRNVVETIGAKSRQVAEGYARENQQYLSKKANDALNKLIEMGDSLTSPGSQNIARANILQDVQQALSTGVRPDKTLKMMQNDVGYQLVKDTMTRSPNGRKIWEGLKRMTVEDMIKSIVDKDKRIDFEKAKYIFENPHLKKVVQESLGKDGYRFFSQLERYGSNMAKNIEKFSRQDPTIARRIAEMKVPAKWLFYALGYFTKGVSLIPILGKNVIERAYYSKLNRVLNSEPGRKTIRELGSKNISKEGFKKALTKLEQFVSRGAAE